MARKSLDISDENINWFEKNYGRDTSLSWIVDLLLSEFREVHTLTPADYAAIGAKNLKRKLDDEIIS